MKPLIKKYGFWWKCAGANTLAFGVSPASAYWIWKQKRLGESVAKAKRVEKATHTMLVVMGITFAITAAITIAWQP